MKHKFIIFVFDVVHYSYIHSFYTYLVNCIKMQATSPKSQHFRKFHNKYPTILRKKTIDKKNISDLNSFEVKRCLGICWIERLKPDGFCKKKRCIYELTQKHKLLPFILHYFGSDAESDISLF